MKTFKQVLEDINLHPGHSIKHHYPGKDKKDIPKGYHLMPDGSIMKNSDHPKKLKASYEDIEDTDEGLSPALKRARRIKRMNTNLQKTMAKYGAATKAGIDPSKVHQRRTQLTVKK